MMFGHDDQQQQQDTTVGPEPDATLNHDGTTAMPTADNGMSAPAPVMPQSDSASDFIMGADPGPSAGMATPGVSDVIDTSSNDDLLGLKQQALQQLTPLLGHLNQSPEEKFRTTMMLIQASDNDKLIPQAYEAAKAITDDKARAQALLDVVNEINYFTQQADNGSVTA